MTHLAIKNWEKFQHYKDRRPPWIKLYTEILEDLEFIQLPEAAQAQLMKLWVLAANIGHPLPNSPKLLAGKIGATGRFYLKQLLAIGFLIPCEQSNTENASADASNSSADLIEKSACHLEERLEEQRIEQHPPLRAVAEHPGLAALVGRLLKAMPDPDIWGAEIEAMLAGMPGHVHTTPAQLEQAITDFIANGAVKNRNIRQFRRYVETSAKAPTTAPRVGVGSGGDPVAVEAAEILADLKRSTITTPNGQRAKPEWITAATPATRKALSLIGGASVIIEADAKSFSFLLRDFTKFYRAAKEERAA